MSTAKSTLEPTSREVAEYLERELELCEGIESEGEDTRVDFQGCQSIWIRPTSKGLIAEGNLSKQRRHQVCLYLGKGFPGRIDVEGLYGK